MTSILLHRSILRSSGAVHVGATRYKVVDESPLFCGLVSRTWPSRARGAALNFEVQASDLHFDLTLVWWWLSQRNGPGGGVKMSPPLRFYAHKTSGLQRPISWPTRGAPV